MGKFDYSSKEQEINNVLTYQSKELEKIEFANIEDVDKTIDESLELLKQLGYDSTKIVKDNLFIKEKKFIQIPTWKELCEVAENEVGSDCQLDELFTPEELLANEEYIKFLNAEYNSIHKLDKIDIAICVGAGLLSAAVDVLLVGITQYGNIGIKEGSLADWIRREFLKKYPIDEMDKLANSKASKVPYDAQDNRNTIIDIDGLSSKYHRLISLGHDPLLGFIVGVLDIFKGNMTTIDKTGHIVSQHMDVYEDRMGNNLFVAIAKQVMHLKSDINTPAGLPAPMMALFNLFQFGEIGEEKLTIAEIVQSMYGQGYDFIHFCSMSIPVMISEVFVRLGYAIKRIKEGHSIKDYTPISLNRDKKPKLETMLFSAHSIATAVNCGKIYFTKNPLNINYPQWQAFMKYSYSQLKWTLMEKPIERDKYVMGAIDEELYSVIASIDDTYNIVMN